MRTISLGRLTWSRAMKYIKRAAPLALADAVILMVAYFVLYSIRLETISLSYWTETVFLVTAIAFTIFSLHIFGGYRRIWASTSGHDAQIIIGASIFSAVLTCAVNLFLQPRPFPLSVVLAAQLVAMTGFVAVRYQTHLISGLKWRWDAIWHERYPQQPTNVLIIGAGEAGQAMAWRMKRRAPKEHRYNIVGFVDDDETKQGLYIESCPILGGRADIPRLTQAHTVDLIVVALHNISGPDFRDILTYCERTKARIKIAPDVFALFDSKNGAPMLRNIQAEDLLGRQPLTWKDGVDITAVAQKVTLVTGAAGSLGSELCRQMLNHKPTQLILLDNNETGLQELFDELKQTRPDVNIKPFLVDITDCRNMERLFELHHPQVVFHSAAYKHVPMLERYPDEAIRVNVEGTRNVARLAQQNDAERFVLISTDKAVNPSSIMGASKRVCELLMHAFSLHGASSTRFTSVRFGNVLGSRGSVVPIFMRQIDAGGPIKVTDPRMTRYFMTIPEAVNLVIHAACLTEGDDLFMLRMGEVVRIIELAERMIRLRGLVPYKDIAIEYMGIRPGEKLHEELSSDTERALPTPHPHIVELNSAKHGIQQPEAFIKRIDSLAERGFDPERGALDQLRNLILLGEMYQDAPDG